MIILAIPNPWGSKSSHRWNSDVLKFHKETDTLAIIPRNTDTRVKMYSFPVLRMILLKKALDINRLMCSEILPSSEHASA